MRIWKHDCGIKVVEVEFNYDCHAYEVYKNDELLGTIYPDDVENSGSMAKDLDNGDCPICDRWEDGCGNTCRSWLNNQIEKKLYDSIEQLENDGYTPADTNAERIIQNLIDSETPFEVKYINGEYQIVTDNRGYEAFECYVDQLKKEPKYTIFVDVRINLSDDIIIEAVKKFSRGMGSGYSKDVFISGNHYYLSKSEIDEDYSLDIDDEAADYRRITVL